MAGVEVNYQNYVEKQKILKENSNKVEDLRQRIADVESKLRVNQEKLNALTEDHEKNFDKYVKDALKKEIKSIEAEFDKKIKNVDDKINKIKNSQNSNEKKYFEILKKNREQIQKLKSYTAKVKDDINSISKIYPDFDVKAALDGMWESVKEDLNDIDIYKLDVPEDIKFKEGDSVYNRLGFKDAVKIIFNPNLNTMDIIPRKRLIVSTVVNYISLICILIGLFAGIGKFYKGAIVLLSFITFLINIYRIKEKPLNNLMQLLVERKDFYFFVLKGDRIVEKYTKIKLNITTRDTDEIKTYYENKIAELSSDLEKYETIVSENIGLRDEKAKLLKNLESEEEALLALRQNRALAIALNKKSKERTKHEKQIVKDYKHRESTYKSTLQAANSTYNQAEKNIETYTAKIKETKEELSKAKNEYKREYEQVSNLETIKNLTKEKENLNNEKYGAVNNLNSTGEKTIRERMLRQYEEDFKALDKENKDLDKKLNRLTEELDKLVSEIDEFKEICAKLAEGFDKIPTVEETEGVLSPNTYIQELNKDSDAVTFSVFDHNYRPSIFLYELDDSNRMGNVTQQLENFLKSLIEGFYRTNAINTIQQSLVDTVTGAKTFQSPAYSSILKVYEKNSMLRELIEQIEAEIKKVVNSSKGSIAEANRIRVKDSDPPFKYQIVYVMVPSGDNSGIHSIVNEDILRLMYDGDKYGFLPIFFIDVSEWNKYKSGNKTENAAIYEKLANMINQQNIYLVDDVNCSITKY